jgi:hypothetical protein
MPALNNAIYLLDNRFTAAIQQYMTPEYLLVAVKWMLIGVAILVSVIYLYLFYKKRNFFFKERVQLKLEPLISQIIMDEVSGEMEIPKNITGLLHNPFAAQYAIDDLIISKKNFSGTVASNLVALYLQLDLKKNSLKKLNDKRWHIKARGIQELYQMEQGDMLKAIYHQTNNRNEFVRMEAQTGVIHLTGFPGLRFLDVITYPITEWQQLKLLEQLRLYPVKEDVSVQIPNWLKSMNDTVVVFALKLSDEYQYFNVRNEVVNCLVHPSQQVRSQAIKTVLRLEDDRTSSLLLGYFNKEPYQNQTFILDALKPIATERETVFLKTLLDHPNDMIKLKAAIVLAFSSSIGMLILQKRSQEEPEPFQRILNHIKTVN